MVLQDKKFGHELADFAPDPFAGIAGEVPGP